MNTPQTFLMAGAWTFSALMLSATAAHAADPRPLTITDVSGGARIQQALPCGNTVDLTTSIVRGYMQMTWLPATRGGDVLVDLTQLTMFLAPFHVEATCAGVRGSVDFREIGAQIASAVRFTATRTQEPGLYRFRIPKEQFLIYESVLSDAPFRQPESMYKRPSEDVTGLLDVRRQIVQLHVVLGSQMRFRAGCEGDRCAIDETHIGTTTTDVRGGSFAGAPPAVMCMPGRLGNSFEVNASGGSAIKLGAFTLANNEVIQLLPSNEPGVRLLPSNRGDRMRQFKAGPGDAFILATDPANLSAIAYCR
jgi:hypothetical protein